MDEQYWTPLMSNSNLSYKSVKRAYTPEDTLVITVRINHIFVIQS